MQGEACMDVVVDMGMMVDTIGAWPDDGLSLLNIGAPTGPSGEIVR
jgi:hypothetical protein